MSKLALRFRRSSFACVFHMFTLRRGRASGALPGRLCDRMAKLLCHILRRAPFPPGTANRQNVSRKSRWESFASGPLRRVLWLFAQELHSTSVNLASLRVALRFNETVSRSPVAGEAITPLSGCKVEEVEWLATMSISS